MVACSISFVGNAVWLQDLSNKICVLIHVKPTVLSLDVFLRNCDELAI